MLQIPGLGSIVPSDLISLVIIAIVLIVGLVILIAIVKVVLHFFLAVVGGVIVWYLTGRLLYAAIGFLVIAIITTAGRKQKVVYAGQPGGKICPNCKLTLAPNARYCPNCGASV